MDRKNDRQRPPYTKWVNQLLNLFQQTVDAFGPALHFNAILPTLDVPIHQYHPTNQSNEFMNKSYQIVHCFLWGLFWYGANSGMVQAQSQEWVTALQQHAQATQNDSLARAQAYNELATIYYNRDLQQARRYHRNALKLLTQTPPALERGYAHLNEAYFRYGQGQYAAAIEQAQQASKIAEDRNSDLLEAASNAQLSLIYSTKGYAYEGTAYALKALVVLRELEKGPKLALPYYQVGNAYILLSDTARALTYFRLAMNDEVRQEQDYLVALIDVERGLLHVKRREWAKARTRLRYALEQSESQNNIRGIAYASYALGVLANAEQYYEQALAYFQKANDIYDRLEDNLGMARVLQGMSSVALSRREYDEAIDYLNDALRRARLSRAMVMVQNIYQSFALVHQEMGEYEQAMKYQQKYHSAKDSILNHDKNRAIAEIESRYHMQELKLKNAELEGRNLLNIALRAETMRNQRLRNRQNSYVIIGLSSFFIFCLIIGFLVYRQDKLNNRIREKGLEQKALRAQMNPHFLFNSLNSIQSLIATDRNAEASIYLAKFSRLMRRILQNSREAFIPLSQEMEFLDNYMELEQRRFTEAFEYELWEEVEDPHFMMIQPMVIQPFIENAIIHGLLRQSKKGQLSVCFKEHSETLIQCIIEDNGIGREAAANFKTDENKQSLGVKITEQRLQQFIKDRNVGPAVRYVDLVDAQGQAAGTRVEVLLPIKFKA